MTPAVGSRIGSFEITGALGAGGMGEVYRARDTKLAREVALKILPDAFASDPDRRARFEREAQVLASLNHPNIAAIHGVESGPPAGGSHVLALVLELVDGPTLADRILEGPIPLDEALPIARQIAEALEAAHAQGIIHRDLKPANIKLRSDGLVKVLDFGLAKALDPLPAPADASLSPTMTSPAMTRLGMILGTAAYMSPEQARGFSVDAKADIWAFGVVLYEMLTGRTLFNGPTVSDTIAAVLRSDVDWSRVPPDVPRGVRTLLERCLQRDLKRRLQHIGDARIELEDSQNKHTDRPAPEKRAKGWALVLLSAAITAAVIAPIAWALKPPSSAPPTAPVRFVVRTPYDLAGARMSPLDLSRDGRQLAYVAIVNGKLQVFYQSLDSFTPRLLEGAEGAWEPFFSPKGDAVGFWTQSSGQFRQVSVGGGAATRIVEAAEAVGSSWGDNGTLVFSAGWGRPLRMMRPGASTAVDLTRMNTAEREGAHLWPSLLPGNRAALFTIWTGAASWDETELAVVDLATRQHRVILRGANSGRYAESGHLVFWRGNSLLAVPFDLETLTVKGDPVRVVSGVRLDNFSGAAHYSLAQNGTLAFISGGVDAFTETFVADRAGRPVIRLDEGTPGGSPSFSPDGKHVVLTLYAGGTFGLGVYDLARRLMTRLPLSGDNSVSTWTKAGDRVTFLSSASGEYNYYSVPSDGSGTIEPLFPQGQGFSPSSTDWSTDGRHYVYGKHEAKTGADIWMHTPGDKATPVPLISSAATESNPALSPADRFIAYQSDESGTVEIYVRPFPNVLTRRDLVSRGGGHHPRWGHDGTEIFYASEKGIMRVPVTRGTGTGGAPSFGEPSVAVAMSGLGTFDVSPDGRTFAIERTPTEKAAREIHVVLNWFDELKRLVPR